MKKSTFVLITLFAVFFLFAAPALACEDSPGQAADNEHKETYVAPVFVRKVYRGLKRPGFKGVVFEDGSRDITAKDLEELQRETEPLQKEVNIFNSTRPADPASPAVPVGEETPGEQKQGAGTDAETALDSPSTDGYEYTITKTGRIHLHINGTEYHGLDINSLEWPSGESCEAISETFGGGARHMVELMPRTVTCEEAGASEYIFCIFCGKMLVGPTRIEALGHDYGGWSTPEGGDCRTSMTRFRTCSRCDHEDVDVMGNGDHRWANGEKFEAEENGWAIWGHYEECSVCHTKRRVEEGREKIVTPVTPEG